MPKKNICNGIDDCLDFTDEKQNCGKQKQIFFLSNLIYVVFDILYRNNCQLNIEIICKYNLQTINKRRTQVSFTNMLKVQLTSYGKDEI